jgi:peptidoglycan/LPS O-acetylase OafA/YrhL
VLTGIAASVAASVALYRWVEKPLRRLMRLPAGSHAPALPSAAAS